MGTIFGLVLAVVVGIPLSTFFHELGHAVAGLLVSRKQIYVYIGSLQPILVYGDGREYQPPPLLKLRLGRLTINWFRWWPGRKGYCYVEDYERIDSRYRLLILLGGSFASFLLLVICIVVAYSSSVHEVLTAFFAGCAVFAFWSLISSFIPTRYLPFAKESVGVANDGTQILRLLHQRKPKDD